MENKNSMLPVATVLDFVNIQRMVALLLFCCILSTSFRLLHIVGAKLKNIWTWSCDFIWTFNVFSHWPWLLFPLFLSSCLFHICLSSPFLLLITRPRLMEQSFSSALNNIFQNPSPEATDLSALPEGQQQWQWFRSSLHSCSLFSKHLAWNTCTQDASCAWLCLSLFTWCCLVACDKFVCQPFLFSRLKLILSLMMLPACSCSSGS